MQKTFVLDTNVLLHNPDALFDFEDNDVVLPITVLEELDSFKTDQGEIGRNARKVSRNIDELRSNGSLEIGVELGDGMGKLFVLTDNTSFTFPQLKNNADNYILGQTRQLAMDSKDQVVLVTKDINLRIKADALGLEAEDYLFENTEEDPSKIGSIKTIKISSSEISAFYRDSDFTIDIRYMKSSPDSPYYGFRENECVIAQSFNESDSVLLRCRDDQLRRIRSKKELFGIYPRNAEQRFLVDLLTDPRLDLVVVNGVSGCLTGDTIIDISRKSPVNQSFPIRLDALYYRFNNLHNEAIKKGILSKNTRRWRKSIPTSTFSYKQDESYIGFNEIAGVVMSGIKEVFTITTDFGQQIKATADHKFMTKTGDYVRLADLSQGDEICTRKSGHIVDGYYTGRKESPPCRQINNVGNHPNARYRKKNGLTYSSHQLHRLVVEAQMNDMRLEEFLYFIEGNTLKLRFLDPNTEVHHKDGNRANNTIENLVVLSKAEHAKTHYNHRRLAGKRYCMALRFQKIASIDNSGYEQTYDIQMKAPYHNFVANGFIVHNSGKTLLSTAAGLDLVADKKTNGVLITKAIQAVGNDIGFLPGDKYEKLREWLKPFFDNLEILIDDKMMREMYFEKGLIEMDALTYIRGRSLMNRYIIIDEVQNLTPKHIKTIVTRVADSSKLILLGDLQQIDNPYLDLRNCGLAYVMSKLSGCHNVGTLSMVKSERGRLAKLAVDRL